jgi:hypothetical protein
MGRNTAPTRKIRLPDTRPLLVHHHHAPKHDRLCLRSLPLSLLANCPDCPTSATLTAPGLPAARKGSSHRHAANNPHRRPTSAHCTAPTTPHPLQNTHRQAGRPTLLALPNCIGCDSPQPVFRRPVSTFHAPRGSGTLSVQARKVSIDI